MRSAADLGIPAIIAFARAWPQAEIVHQCFDYGHRCDVSIDFHHVAFLASISDADGGGVRMVTVRSPTVATVTEPTSAAEFIERVNKSLQL